MVEKKKGGPEKVKIDGRLRFLQPRKRKTQMI